ncbi:OTU-like cysteine protease domain-containing protein [Ditylenchus destructor]|nr:OTU-like cysteine protease domain-containing protein [Ditylenchus destructor]
MFRAVADQIYGDEEMHDNVRSLCMDYIAKNRDHFSQFVTEDFDLYLRRKREMDTHGNHVELQAVSEIFLRPIEIYEYSIDPINTFHPISPEANTGHENPPLRLSYHGTVHYNSVIDPFSATVGVGLGLPEYKPGSADRNLMKEAALASEAQHIEEAMLNDKLRMTDWERTEEELGKQIARDSYMEYLRQLEQNAEESYKHNTDESHEKDELEEPMTTKPADNKLSSPLTVSTDNIEQRTNSRVGQRCLPSTSRHSSSLGAKRGASSPNIPCCSRDERNRELGSSPLAKVHKNETSSMPNISPTFGDSLNSRNFNADSMRPSTSASSFSRSLGGAEFYSQTGNNRSDMLLENVASTSAGLYEELLASSALAFDDWAGSTAALDDAAILARAMAVSQAEFYENLRKSPRS